MRYRTDTIVNVPNVLIDKTAKVKCDVTHVSYMSECKLKRFIEKSKDLQKSLSMTQNRVQFSLKVVRCKCHVIG